MKMFQSEYIKNLPDCYAKDKDSNNYKLLSIAKYSIDKSRAENEKIYESLDLNKATGKTLDLYGEMVGQSRGLANDEQYRILIKTRLMRNLSNGSNKSIVASLATILNCKMSEISLSDKSDAPCTVTLSKVNLYSVQAAGLTTKQFESILKTLLPVGVVFETFSYDGTFEFSETESEYDESKGFCDVEGGTIGGYLGALSSDDDSTILPII